MIKLIDPYKAQVFVAHIQNHLNKNEFSEYHIDYSIRGEGIPIGQVGCKICEKGIERIYNEEKEKWSR